MELLDQYAQHIVKYVISQCRCQLKKEALCVVRYAHWKTLFLYV